MRLAKRILDRTAPLFLSSQLRIYRSRWIDSAINKLNCIMDVSKRVRVPRSKSIIMYMRSSYRLVHLRCLKRPLIHSGILCFPRTLADLVSTVVTLFFIAVQIITSNQDLRAFWIVRIRISTCNCTVHTWIEKYSSSYHIPVQLWPM